MLLTKEMNIKTINLGDADVFCGGKGAIHASRSVKRASKDVIHALRSPFWASEGVVYASGGAICASLTPKSASVTLTNAFNQFIIEIYNFIFIK